MFLARSVRQLEAEEMQSICGLRFGIGKVLFSSPHFLHNRWKLMLLVMGYRRSTKARLHKLDGFGPEIQKNKKGDLVIETLRKVRKNKSAEEGHERGRGEKEEIQRGGSSGRYQGGEADVGGYHVKNDEREKEETKNRAQAELERGRSRRRDYGGKKRTWNENANANARRSESGTKTKKPTQLSLVLLKAGPLFAKTR